MKSILSNLAARYQGKKFFATLGTIGAGVLLIKMGHTTEGAALIATAVGSFNVGQGIADSKQPGKWLAATLEETLAPISRD